MLPRHKAVTRSPRQHQALSLTSNKLSYQILTLPGRCRLKVGHTKTALFPVQHLPIQRLSHTAAQPSLRCPFVTPLSLGIFCEDTQEANDTDYLWGGELGQAQERDFFATDPFKPFALLKQESVLPSQQQTLKGSTSWDCVSINEDPSLTIHFELCAGVNITTTFSTAGRYGFDLQHSFFCCVCVDELCWSVIPLVTPSIFQRAFRNGNAC